MATLVMVAVVSHRRDRRIWLILAARLLPIVATILVSVFRPMLLGRYLVVSLPFIAILAGVGLVRHPTDRRARGRHRGASESSSSWQLPIAYKDDHQQDWRSAGAWIAGAGSPAIRSSPRHGDGVHSATTCSRAETGTVPEATGIRAALTGSARTASGW